MKVLIACEFSGIVREAFAALGHDAWSCDLDETEIPGQHLRCDVVSILTDGWDLMIAHPPCTYLAVSGARWWHAKQAEQTSALAFVQTLWNAPIVRICIENPVSILCTRFARPSQVIQPWQHGHWESKRTCLWLKNLPCLTPSNIVPGHSPAVHYMSPSAQRSKNRSRTYKGIASAMAQQWGFDNAA